MITTCIIGFIVILLIISWPRQKPRNFPPGPPVLPLIGSAPFIPRKHIHMTMATEWKKKYGPLTGFILGPRKAVAVCGHREIMEVLRREEFQGRPKGDFFKERSFNKFLGVFFSDGAFWVEQRRFILRHLRDFGFGKRSMEQIIMDEVEDVMKEMHKKKIFQMTGFFSISTLNVLWSMIAGVRYSREDADLQACLDILTKSLRSGNLTGGILLVFPILKVIAPGITGHTENLNNIAEMQEFFRNSIREHLKTMDDNNPRDLIDAYMKEVKLQEHNSETYFTEEGLITICMDLFSAGGETTTSSLGFSLLYMVLHPNIQTRVQKEIDAIIGKGRRPCLEDRSKMHYTEAVLTELLRVCTIAPITPPHRATKDTYINDYYIPKNTSMLCCLYSIFQDKEHWGDPEVFKPERFLDADGKFVKDEWMIPFGYGKRICLGEVLARSTIFLFFTSLLQEFSFSVPEGDPQPSTFPLSGITIAPQPFRVKVTKRL